MSFPWTVRLVEVLCYEWLRTSLLPGGQSGNGLKKLNVRRAGDSVNAAISGWTPLYPTVPEPEFPR